MPTAISWTNETWNPTTGCSRVSEGCRYCYAERISLARGWSKKPWTAANAKENVLLHPDRLRKPYTWKQPMRVFVDSMSDLFHPLVPDEFIAEVFEVMVDLPQHRFQILTKRPERAATWPGPWAPNVWMGTSVENEKVVGRIDHIRRCGARIRFLSLEPLIGPLPNLDLTGIHWVIVGGESGAKFRPMKMEWARDLRDQCERAAVPYFFKQDAGSRTEMRPWLVEEDGQHTVYHQYPDDMAAPVAAPAQTALI